MDIRTNMCEHICVNGHEFERLVRKAGRRNGVAVSFDPGQAATAAFIMVAALRR